MSILNKQQEIEGYVVTFPVKQGMYAETYRVKDRLGNNFFLKLINCAKLHHSQFDENGNVLELEIVKQLKHHNIAKYHDSGKLILNGQKFVYIIFEFITGETTAQYIAREQSFSVYDVKRIISGVLNGLKYMHSLPRPIVHNELTIQNVMLDLSGGISIPKIIDFGYARYIDQDCTSYMQDGLSPFYIAPEAFNGVFSPQSDLFSVGAMLYHLLFGMPPYFIDLSPFKAERVSLIDVVQAERKRPLRILDPNKFEMDELLINIMHRALAFDIDERFATADEFIRTLNGEIDSKLIGRKISVGNDEGKTEVAIKKKGNGFLDVAGMVELKEQLQSDVIDLIQAPMQAKELGLFIPNGLLFYGPPGCGKTFFAEKFAEETGFNYKYIKCSDVASPYIHGGQGKIAAIFDDARKNAPTILFFDEIDAMIKDRSKQTNVSEAGEVNEFLAQLNNCGQDGVLVIGATNKPTDIDEAALRAGRLELKYYIPQPDKETREKIFEINLQNRKNDFGIDYGFLASLTENYISADIKLIVDTAARLAFRRKIGKITMTILEEVIRESRPSVSIDVIHRHEAIRDKFIGMKKEDSQRKKIGF